MNKLKKIRNRIYNAISSFMALTFLTMSVFAEGNIANSVIATGTKKLIADVSSWLTSIVADNAKNTYTFIVNESEMRKQKEQLLQSNEYRWAQAIDDLTLFKNILGEKNQLIADLYREKSELEEANKELDEVIKTQAKQIEELNAKLNPDKHVHSQEQGMYPTL